MPSKKQAYITDINRLLRNETLSPNRRAVLFALKMWFSMDAGPDRDFIRGVIEEQFGTRSRVRWTDNEDEKPETLGQTNLDKEATAKIKNLFEEALKERP